MYQKQLHINTQGRGTYDITQKIQQIVAASNVQTGLCQVFVQHTSASLIICENADPDVRHDLEQWLSRQIEDGARYYQHSQEGPDDMPAHIRAILTNMDLTLPITRGRCALGTWQGIFLYEHRYQAHTRNLIVTVMG